MLIDVLQRKLFSASVLDGVVGRLEDGADATIGLATSVRPFLVAALFAKKPRPMFVVVSGQDAAERFARALSAYLPRIPIYLYPERADLPWEDMPANKTVLGKQAKALGTLALGRAGIVVAGARALLRRVAVPDQDTLAPIRITRNEGVVDVATGELIAYEDLAPLLVSCGYERLETADEPGSFAVHGGTVDIFGAAETGPVRVEFFGDDVDDLRRIMTSTGQSIQELDGFEVWPCCNEEDGEGGQPIQYASPGTLVVLAEPRSLFDDATRGFDKILERGKEARVSDEKLAASFVTPAKMDFGCQQRLTLLSIMRAGGDVDADLDVKRPSLQGKEEKLFSIIRSLLAKNVTTLFCVPDRHAREDIELMFTDVGIPFVERLEDAQGVADADADADTGVDADAEVPADAAAAAGKPLSTKHLTVCDLDIASGFILPDAHLALLSLSDLSRRTAPRTGAQRIDITEITFPFEPGDYVVHASHGIALFKGMLTKEVAGQVRDYLLLAYAAGDKLFVPVEQIGRVTRYVGPDGSAPRLTRLHTADWSRVVGKAKASAKKLAFDLVDLYARRSAAKGFSYSADSIWQDEMEQVFPFEETPDQLAAIADVKADMESDKPMDRLICGDVGFGKTEVALRAAFKAVCDHRQVMVLCPTTILAQQHYDTFFDRFDPFGISVAVLSRFRSTAQQRKSLEDFASGKLDVLVGTHRLLSRDVNPKNLGLVIIDEEQRFGVGHKEKLKNLRESIDVLTLSATPIPRTLQMSLSGVRDMSLIATPPPNRRPVEVHVGEWDEDIVSGAIRREMERGGQVYYVSNRVKSITDALDRVALCAPEARIGIAHGQMSAHAIEDVMEQFSAGELDVLIATTIVESGLDNPHTNTLVIEDSQRLGLSQLYQLKGRVGRSREQAYAYFLFPANMPLTDEATERLQAIGEFTDLGSGMKVALRDLEIRGAGTLLGAEQSGNMSAVGFDLFASMLASAVDEARAGGNGEQIASQEDSSPGQTSEVRIEFAQDFLLPESYIPAVDERVLAYRRIAAAIDENDADRIERDLRARYGALPEEAANMLARIRLRALARACAVESVFQSGGYVIIQPVSALLKSRVDADDEATETMKSLRALYFSKSRKYKIPLPRDCANPLHVALSAMEAVASVAQEGEGV